MLDKLFNKYWEYALIIVFAIVCSGYAISSYAAEPCIWPSKYDSQIQKSVRRHWALHLPNVDWQVQKALMIQESSLRPDAKAGTTSAHGLGQLVDGTWDEVSRRLDLRGGRRSERDQIEASAFYLAQQASKWNSPRPTNEKLLLGIASYHGGFGTVYRGQVKCDMELFWKDIKPCVALEETKVYPDKITQHYLYLKENCWDGRRK